MDKANPIAEVEAIISAYFAGLKMRTRLAACFSGMPERRLIVSEFVDMSLVACGASRRKLAIPRMTVMML